MIEQLEFYHGAALVRLIEDPRCEAIVKHVYGFRVNQQLLVAIKYSTKARSPWRFNFSHDDINRLQESMKEFRGCSIALVCGGDGICALSWTTVSDLLGGASGWISAKRAHGGCYGVGGPEGTLKRKVAMNRWPGLVFESEDGE
jgi:hypothetical protein